MKHQSICRSMATQGANNMSDQYIKKECLQCEFWLCNVGCQQTNGLKCPIKLEINMSYLDWLTIKHHLLFYDATKGPVYRFIQKIDKMNKERVV